MQTITDMIKDVPIPRMVRVRQIYDRTSIPPEDLPGIIFRELDRPDIGGRIQPGQRIAVTCGSRGIANIARMVRAVVDFVKSRDAQPFVVAAMGSHGGATPQGQRHILADYGVTEQAMGCPILTDMDTVLIGYTETDHYPVQMDKNAAEADGILLLNRVKPHTTFRARYESGLMKMMAIGLGKQAGAQDVHGHPPKLMGKMVEEYGRAVLFNAPVLGGIAVVENAYDETFRCVGLSRDEIVDREPALRDLAHTTLARLLFDECDVLVVDRIGKNISGDGMDPNVTGRYVVPDCFSGGIDAEKLVVLDLTDETHGNAHGLGLADVVTRRLVNKMKLEMTYPTAVTNTFLHVMKIPMIMDNDREAIQLALGCCPEAEDPAHPKLIRIPDTAHIEYIEISEGLLDQARANPSIEILSEPYELPFDEKGDLL